MAARLRSRRPEIPHPPTRSQTVFPTKSTTSITSSSFSPTPHGILYLRRNPYAHGTTTRSQPAKRAEIDRPPHPGRQGGLRPKCLPPWEARRRSPPRLRGSQAVHPLLPPLPPRVPARRPPRKVLGQRHGRVILATRPSRHPRGPPDRPFLQHYPRSAPPPTRPGSRSPAPRPQPRGLPQRPRLP